MSRQASKKERIATLAFFSGEDRLFLRQPAGVRQESRGGLWNNLSQSFLPRIVSPVSAFGNRIGAFVPPLPAAEGRLLAGGVPGRIRLIKTTKDLTLDGNGATGD